MNIANLPFIRTDGIDAIKNRSRLRAVFCMAGTGLSYSVRFRVYAPGVLGAGPRSLPGAGKSFFIRSEALRTSWLLM